jgi:hypothetical protein
MTFVNTSLGSAGDITISSVNECVNGKTHGVSFVGRAAEQTVERYLVHGAAVCGLALLRRQVEPTLLITPQRDDTQLTVKLRAYAFLGRKTIAT